MSWNPYVPGPNSMHSRYAVKSDKPRGPGMDGHTRLTTSMAGPVGVSHFTPDQTLFRDEAQGRWQADFDSGANAPLNQIRQDPASGCCDMIKLEPAGNQYIDLGGRGATDFAIQRP